MNPSVKLTTSTVAARIPYANAAPFYALWADAPFAVRNLVPRELGREAEAGSVDMGMPSRARVEGAGGWLARLGLGVSSLRRFHICASCSLGVCAAVPW